MKKSLASLLTALYFSITSETAEAPESEQENISNTKQGGIYDGDNFLDTDELLDIAVKILEHNQEYDYQDEVIYQVYLLCFTMQLIHGYDDTFEKSAYVCSLSFFFEEDSIRQSEQSLEYTFGIIESTTNILNSETSLCDEENASNIPNLIIKLSRMVNRYYSVLYDGNYVLNLYSELEMFSKPDVVELMNTWYEFSTDYQLQIRAMENDLHRLNKLLDRLDECPSL